jgi:NAD(P)H-hydrate epimerase
MPLSVLTIEQMRDWEKATWATGQTELEVMRRAGQALAQTALRMTRTDDLILIVAGKGHNGDDSRFAVEHLAKRRVDIFDVLDPREDFSKLEQRLRMSPALLIDGLFGIGINRPLSADWVRFIERINAAKLKVLAVDVPSGLNGDTGEPQPIAVEACVTLTVGAPKVGMLRQSAWPFVGRLEVAHEVGLVPCPSTNNLRWTLPEDFTRFPPPRVAAGHKGTYGHAALLAGSPGYHGAAVLASRGAQRARPGLITLYTLPAVYAVIASQLQAVMVSPWNPELKLAENCTAIMAGPGLASPEVPEQLKDFVRQTWRDGPVPMVVDASALSWLTPGPVRPEAIRVITPHPGEAARLLGITSQKVQSERVQALRRLSERFGNTWIILKGHQTLVGRSTGDLFVNGSGNPYLAQGGSGDLLSGYVAGLMAQPSLANDPFTILRYAVWQHGACADLLQASRSGWVIEDLAVMLGQISPKLEGNAAL